jgi:hypothetical protein
MAVGEAAVIGNLPSVCSADNADIKNTSAAECVMYVVSF